jgi:hypothetical protein
VGLEYGVDASTVFACSGVKAVTTNTQGAEIATTPPDITHAWAALKDTDCAQGVDAATVFADG